MIEQDDQGHAFAPTPEGWHVQRCQRCGIWHYSPARLMRCPGERHDTVEETWTPAVPLGMFGDNPSLGLGMTLPMSEPETPSAPSFESTAFEGGTSGGGGAGADFSSGPAEAPSQDVSSSSADSGANDVSSSGNVSSSDAGGSSDFGSGGSDFGSGT